MPGIQVDRNAILQYLDNAEVLAGFDEVTRDEFKLAPYLEKGFIDGGDVVKYYSDELGGGYEYREKGLSYEEKRALTVTTEVVSEEMIKQAISDPKVSGRILENKIGGMAKGVARKMWYEFLEKICRYDPNLYNKGSEDWLHPSSRPAARDTYYYGKVGDAPQISDKTGQLTSKIIEKDLSNLNQHEFAAAMTQLISGISEGKQNTRAGSDAKCGIDEIILILLTIIPATLDNNFQAVGMNKANDVADLYKSGKVSSAYDEKDILTLAKKDIYDFFYLGKGAIEKNDLKGKTAANVKTELDAIKGDIKTKLVDASEVNVLGWQKDILAGLDVISPLHGTGTFIFIASNIQETAKNANFGGTITLTIDNAK
ncbi:19914_t:CDS:2, partial [Racocetra persica]